MTSTEEVEDPTAELRALQEEADEEERRAMGGWSAATFEEFQREFQSQNARRSYLAQNQSVPAGEITGTAAATGSVRVPGIPMHLDKTPSRNITDVYMASPDSAAATDTHVENMEAADGMDTRVFADETNPSHRLSKHAAQTQLEGTNTAASDAVGSAILGFSGIATPEGAIFAQPISAVSAEGAALLDLIEARPLQAHADHITAKHCSQLPTAPTQAPPTAAHVTTQSNMLPDPNALPSAAHPTPSQAPKIQPSENGRKPTPSILKIRKPPDSTNKPQAQRKSRAGLKSNLPPDPYNRHPPGPKNTNNSPLQPNILSGPVTHRPPGHKTSKTIPPSPSQNPIPTLLHLPQMV